jgi:hypothetical protein
MVWSEDGTEMHKRRQHWENALFAKFESFEALANLTVSRFRHTPKQQSPKASTDGGMKIDDRLPQS